MLVRDEEILTGTPKAEAIAMIERLPDDVTFEDIQYHLYVLEKIKRGIQRAETEGVIPHEEVRARLSQWLDS
jgi:predicted transcriptional regulator